MGAMSTPAALLRAELETAMLQEAERLGPDGFDRAAVVGRFMDRGVGRSTVFRWAAAIVASGRLGQHVTRKVREAAETRAARTPEPAKEVAGEIATMLPVRVSVDEVVKGGGSTLKVIDKLNSIVVDLDALVAHAKTPDGAVRNARLLLAASGELRKCLETAVKLYEAMREVDQVDRLHDAIIDEIEKLSPVTAEAIYRRLDQVAAQWGG
jgi:hypothetical protein